jgi:CheY-like chemotaxis protein
VKILLVEDEDAQRGIMLRYLQKDGHEVVWSSTAVGAIRLLLGEIEKPIQCVLLDVHLGDFQLTGFDVARFMKSDDNLRTIPIVVVSGMGAADVREKARSDALKDVPYFVDKPVDWPLLHQILHRIEHPAPEGCPSSEP